jgi:hypothetical protein
MDVVETRVVGNHQSRFRLRARMDILRFDHKDTHRLLLLLFIIIIFEFLSLFFYFFMVGTDFHSSPTMFASSVLTGKGGNRYRATLNEIQNHLGQLRQPTSISGASYFYKFHTCWNDLERILTWTNRFEPDEIQIPQF